MLAQCVYHYFILFEFPVEQMQKIVQYHYY